MSTIHEREEQWSARGAAAAEDVLRTLAPTPDSAVFYDAAYDAEDCYWQTPTGRLLLATVERTGVADLLLAAWDRGFSRRLEYHAVSKRTN